MTVSEFKAVVAAGGGESRVISIMFDNGISWTFTDPDREFSYAKNLDEATQCLIWKDEVDFRGYAYTLYKHVENVQGIMFAGNKITGEPIPRTVYDKKSIRNM